MNKLVKSSLILFAICASMIVVTCMGLVFHSITSYSFFVFVLMLYYISGMSFLLGLWYITIFVIKNEW
jgi:hypothetical protein